MSTSRPGVVWTHNDSGGEAELYAVDIQGQLVGRVSVAGADNVDWEDLASGPCGSGNCLYIADTGDNAAERNDAVIYRIPEPSPNDATTQRAEVFPIAFPGNPQDVEGVFVLPPDRLFLVTKGGDGPVAIYRYPGPLRAGERVVLELVRRLSDETVPLEDRVTAADATATGDRVGIRTRTTLLIYDANSLTEGGDLQPLRVDLRPLGEPQGEGLAFGPNDTLVMTSEGAAEGFSGNLGILWCP